MLNIPAVQMQANIKTRIGGLDCARTNGRRSEQITFISNDGCREQIWQRPQWKHSNTCVHGQSS